MIAHFEWQLFLDCTSWLDRRTILKICTVSKHEVCLVVRMQRTSGLQAKQIYYLGLEKQTLSLDHPGVSSPNPQVCFSPFRAVPWKPPTISHKKCEWMNCQGSSQREREGGGWLHTEWNKREGKLTAKQNQARSGQSIQSDTQDSVSRQLEPAPPSRKRID